jgi:hypothetical protein
MLMNSVYLRDRVDAEYYIDISEELFGASSILAVLVRFSMIALRVSCGVNLKLGIRFTELC